MRFLLVAAACVSFFPSPPAFGQSAGDDDRVGRQKVRRVVKNPQERTVAVNESPQRGREPTENLTLAFKGSLPGAMTLDLELTGCGPHFMIDLTSDGSKEEEGEGGGEQLPPSIVSVQSLVTEMESGAYRVNYELGVRVAVVTSSSRTTSGARHKNIEFRDQQLQGTVIVRPGNPVDVSKVDGKVLTISVSPAG